MGAGRTHRLLGRFALVLGLAAIVAGCGSGARQLSPRHEAELKLERSDLVLASRELERLEPILKQEVQAARKAWPAIENGLGSTVSSATVAAVARASARAQAVVLPHIFQPESGALTGPASGIAGLMQEFSALGVRGWRLLRQAVEGAGTPAATRFERENAGLYIDCVYQGHFFLGVIGKKLIKSYERLGAEEGFGARLTLARVKALADAYSSVTFELPHPPLTLSD